MKIAVNGCCHGELNKIYDTISYIENHAEITVDLLICCGDFQSVRNASDLKTMASPEKYHELKDFHEYYNGKKKAPVLTLFIGGNHESANYLWELPYGGWVAENIFYLGFAGVVNFGGLRIAGLSGIYKEYDYHKSHYEKPPFNEKTKRSFYHVRSCDAAKLKLLRENEVDIFLSHDWPRGICSYGDWKELIKAQPSFQDVIEKDTSSQSLASQELLSGVKPNYWFAGHMHTKFVAIVDHPNQTETKFLAVGKCLPQEDFLQIVDIEAMDDERVLKYDPEWICILQKCDSMQGMLSKNVFMKLDESCKPTDKDISAFKSTYNDLNVFEFSKSINGVNDQTNKFCDKFQLFNPCATLSKSKVSNVVGTKPSFEKGI